MRWVLKALLAIDSLCVMYIIFSANNKFWIEGLGPGSLVIYTGIVFALTATCLWLCRFLSADSIEGGIRSVELANDSYLPTYLGYFFVALSIQEWIAFWVVFTILFVFLLVSQNVYYNPILLLWGYHFYRLENESGKRVFIITKKEIGRTAEVKIPELHRINDFVFIDLTGR